MFRNLFIREGYVYDYQYDWLPLLSEEDVKATVVRKPVIKASSELPAGFPQKVNSAPNMKRVQLQASADKKLTISSRRTISAPKKATAPPSRGSFGRKK